MGPFERSRDEPSLLEQRRAKEELKGGDVLLNVVPGLERNIVLQRGKKEESKEDALRARSCVGVKNPVSSMHDIFDASFWRKFSKAKRRVQPHDRAKSNSHGF